MTTSTTTTNRKEIRALQFNVWLDGTRVPGGIGLIADTILQSKADIVSLVEVKNLLGDFVDKLQKELNQQRSSPADHYYGQFAGNPHKFGFDADTAILSKFPINLSYFGSSIFSYWAYESSYKLNILFLNSSLVFGLLKSFFFIIFIKSGNLGFFLVILISIILLNTKFLIIL